MLSMHVQLITTLVSVLPPVSQSEEVKDEEVDLPPEVRTESPPVAPKVSFTFIHFQLYSSFPEIGFTDPGAGISCAGLP